jgi:hypothetical protein
MVLKQGLYRALFFLKKAIVYARFCLVHTGRQGVFIMSKLSVSESDRQKIAAVWGNGRAVMDAALATSSFSELNLSHDAEIRSGAKIAVLVFETGDNKTPDDFIAAFEKEVLNGV